MLISFKNTFRATSVLMFGQICGYYGWAKLTHKTNYTPERTVSNITIVVQSQSCPTLCDPVDSSTPGFPVLHHLPDLAQTHVRWVGDAIQPSHPLSPLSPPAIFSSIRVLTSEVALCIRWQKYWHFSSNISASKEYSGLISFKIDWFYFLEVQGLLRVFPNTTAQEHQFFSAQLSLWSSSHPYMTTGRTIALTRLTFIGKVMSLIFNMLSRLALTFLPRSKHLLISWLQSTSAVILEPKKIKSVTISIIFPSICHEMMGLDAMILVFWILSFEPAFSLSSFTFIKRLFSSS